MRKHLNRTLKVTWLVIHSETLIDLEEHLWTFVGAFVGIGLIGYIQHFYLPPDDNTFLVGSFGASAVLIYGVVNSPLAQPRNLIGGHVLSAILGVTISGLVPVPWLAAALAVSSSIVLMQMTRTLHPPGGATALIAVTGSEGIKSLGYLYVLFPILSGAVILLAVALYCNDAAGRSYPKNRHWFKVWKRTYVPVRRRLPQGGMRTLLKRVSLFLIMTLGCAGASTAQPLRAAHGDFVIKNFTFTSGEVLPALRLHYRTLGKPVRNAKGQVTNAVLIMHGTNGSGGQFESSSFAGQLFVKGGLLDANRYFLIMPDAIGFGQSSKPSDGLRARFPRYGYIDVVTSQYRLLTEGLGVNHLRLVMGTSMGGMLTWLWGQRYPDFVDALMPLASLPAQISGRNRIWRRVIVEAIRNDPEWNGGNYTTQPQSVRTVQLILFLVGGNPVLRQQMMPTLAESDRVLDAVIAQGVQGSDANDLLYAFEASRDYDPGPGLEKIRAPLFAVNTADDFIDPPELGILEREIKRVPRGRAIVIPPGPDLRGHGTHTIAAVWKQYLAELLKMSEKSGP